MIVRLRFLVVGIAYMRSNEISNEIETKAPPNSAKDVACDFLHSSHHADAMVNLWEKLEQKH